MKMLTYCLDRRLAFLEVCVVYSHSPRSRRVFTIAHWRTHSWAFVTIVVISKGCKVVCGLLNPRLDIWCSFFNRNDAYASSCLNNARYLIFQCVPYFEYARWSSLLVNVRTFVHWLVCVVVLRRSDNERLVFPSRKLSLTNHGASTV